ncbi:unnamed protein product [Timema podura]|uniref:Uncharacterized protein n=1 Tax=Timema podura TaxID=61482 RepID=A0ABN7NIA0_TIMPD|nr:unnamed protein product [Timema podura]
MGEGFYCILPTCQSYKQKIREHLANALVALSSTAEDREIEQELVAKTQLDTSSGQVVYTTTPREAIIGGSAKEKRRVKEVSYWAYFVPLVPFAAETCTVNVRGTRKVEAMGMKFVRSKLAVTRRNKIRNKVIWERVRVQGVDDSRGNKTDMVRAYGTIHQGSTPWRAWILKLFWGVINFIIMFFKSLFNPELHKKGSRYTTDYRPNGRGVLCNSNPPFCMHTNHHIHFGSYIYISPIHYKHVLYGNPGYTVSIQSPAPTLWARSVLYTLLTVLPLHLVEDSGALAPEDRGIWLAVEGALWQVDEVKNGPCNLHPLDYLGPSSNV